MDRSFKVSINIHELNKVITVLKGLSYNQIKNFINQITCDGELNSMDIDKLIKLKKETFDADGFLEFCPTENIDNIAGFDNLKKWLKVRKSIFLNDSHNLQTPKGILLMGIQGCGKSTAIKAIAKELDIPLYRMDLSKLYSSYMGETEENLRKTITVIEKLSPICLWIDEIEKGFTISDGRVDGGVSQRLLGTFLTWMQERTGKCFIAATANQVHKLPPEFLRKGRFDEIFFVDLPNIKERETLISIHLKKRGFEPSDFNVQYIAQKTESFSGAEIEQAIISALYNVVSENKKLDDKKILQEVIMTKPLAIMKAEDIDVLRLWAKEKTLPV
jgi:SpoVK/Ycf46/Vps4 family AAA+-type ATPase